MAKRSDDQLYQLPETSAASRGAKVKLDALLREAHSLRQVEKRLKQVKSEISELVQAQGLANDGLMGARLGDLCCIIRYQNGKRSLDRTLLVENGVTPAQIEASEKQGAGYWMVELPVIGADEV